MEAKDEYGGCYLSNNKCLFIYTTSHHDDKGTVHLEPVCVARALNLVLYKRSGHFPSFPHSLIHLFIYTTTHYNNINNNNNNNTQFIWSLCGSSMGFLLCLTLPCAFYLKVRTDRGEQGGRKGGREGGRGKCELECERLTLPCAFYLKVRTELGRAGREEGREGGRGKCELECERLTPPCAFYLKVRT